MFGQKLLRPVFDRKADVPTTEEFLSLVTQLTCRGNKKLHINSCIHHMVFKSNFNNSHTYIILIRSRSYVLRSIQLHSHRQPEHSGDSDVEVILVYEGALQVVRIWSWGTSLWGRPGCLLERMINNVHAGVKKSSLCTGNQQNLNQVSRP